ncbi:hypothetical protein X943_002248 [Babesia divergens]|uniref:Uncharacterized protein n=1 Tax=Babesia divergens TaxID=32595 RepID=A0AAD9G5G7_BABDI|nr:hypothetical protein X943_002248 [Babesia divergens]
MTETCDFKDPKNLKDILVELYKLHGMDQTKPKVFEQLKTYLGTYCAEAYLNDFYGYRHSYSSYGGTILLLTKAGHDICEAILQSPTGGRSVDTHSKHTGQNCAERIANAIKACLPKAYAALYYLYFMGDKSLKETIKGGKWDNKCNQTGNVFNNWLTDDRHYGKMKGLIARGFASVSSRLTSNTAENVAEKLKSAVSLNIQGDDGSLQNVLCGFMFVCKWDDALLGHALLFLSKFCEKVGSDYTRDGGETFNQFRGKFERKFNGSFDEMQKRCNEVNNGLRPFTLGLGNTDSKLYAVCQRNTNLFNDLWDDKNFDKYCDWLRKHLKNIIEALKDMSEKCKQWTKGKLKDASSAGPSRFGFVPKQSDWMNRINENLQGPITSLIEPLEKLEKALQTSSSAGATAGGVFTGLFGLGGAGAGAAYATNAFGFQNLVTSFISSFLK